MRDRLEIINNWKLERIFNELENGNMKIPRFQRGYVWERSKIIKLLNSIYKQYPIGSFFLWETNSDMENFCRYIPELGFPKKSEANKFSFILDGQQRITSLYVSLKGKILNGTDYTSICFNLDKKIFKIPTLTTEPNNIPVWEIYDDSKYSQHLMEYSSKSEKEHASTLIECHTILKEYPVSIIKSMNMDLDEVVTIFERINQGGKRLSLFDLVHASVWSEDFDLRERISTFNSETAIELFGTLDGEIFTQSLALNVTGDCTNKHQLHLTNQQCKDNWENTLECIRLAIDFVKELGVKQFSIIPYASQLPIIQYYFFKSGQKYIHQEIKELIKDWFWTVAFSQRYSSSSLTRMNEDAIWIDKLVAGVKEGKRYTVNITVDDLKKIRMDRRSVIKNSILCLMAQNGPLDFDNSGTVTIDKTNVSRSNAKENHHFFPYSIHKDLGLSSKQINSILNFAFITRRLNGQISNQRPSSYLTAYEKQNANITSDLKTHFITEDAFEAAKQDEFEKFISIRGNNILDLIKEVCEVGTQGAISNIEEEEFLDFDIDDELVE